MTDKQKQRLGVYDLDVLAITVFDLPVLEITRQEPSASMGEPEPVALVGGGSNPSEFRLYDSTLAQSITRTGRAAVVCFTDGDALAEINRVIHDAPEGR